ncbi:MAG: DUF1772 domain-containing protein [Gammaproteobacteria bacterium]
MPPRNVVGRHRVDGVRVDFFVHAATVFTPSYRRAALIQVSLAALGFLCAVIAWLAGGTLWWLVGGLLLGLVIPFTWLVIMPTNQQLLSPTLDRRSSHTRELLVRWGQLHAVRSILSLVALVIFLFSA